MECPICYENRNLINHCYKCKYNICRICHNKWKKQSENCIICRNYLIHEYLFINLVIEIIALFVVMTPPTLLLILIFLIGLITKIQLLFMIIILCLFSIY